MIPLVVLRDARHCYEDLQSEFADEADVLVILDRRLGERRQDERRQRERRAEARACAGRREQYRRAIGRRGTWTL